MSDIALALVRRVISRPDAPDLIVEYFATTPGDRGGFSGAWFERLGGGGDRAEVGDRFTAEDLIAVSMLGVYVPPRSAKVLLVEQAPRFGRLLRSIPLDARLVDASGREILRDPDGAPLKLWRALMELHQVGPTITSKLMARKRPHLIPVYDDVVSRHLAPWSDSWITFIAAFENIAIVERLDQIRCEAGAHHVSLPRILDVLLWRDAPRQERQVAV